MIGAESPISIGEKLRALRLTKSRGWNWVRTHRVNDIPEQGAAVRGSLRRSRSKSCRPSGRTLGSEPARLALRIAPRLAERIGWRWAAPIKPAVFRWFPGKPTL